MSIDQAAEPKPIRVSSLRNVLSGLIYCHLFIIFFQIPLRAVILDMTFWRDIGIFLIISIWFVYRFGFLRLTLSRRISLETLVSCLIFYGIINLFVNLFNGVSLLEAATNFRNHFLPFMLFFPARYVFRDENKQIKLLFYLSIILSIYMFAPVVEMILKSANFPLSQIPWYQHSFNNSTRFEGNESSAYIKIEDTPILGLLGYPHYTVVPIVGLFALIYPFLFAGGGTSRYDFSFKIGNSPYYKYFLLFSFLSSIMILQVRTHMISASLVLVLLAPKEIRKRKYLTSAIVILFLVLTFFSFLNPGGLERMAEAFIEGFIGNSDNISSLSAIMSVNELYFIISSNLKYLFFGHGYNAITNVSFDEFLAVNSTGWEVKLVYYTAVYGILWLFIYIWVNVKSLSYIRMNSKLFDGNSFQYRFSQGFKGMIVVFLIDAGHYMRVMTWPSLDVWIVCLAVLVAINSKGENREVEIKS